MENSDNILKQLKIIKWLVIFISACIFIVAGSFAGFSYIASKSMMLDSPTAEDFSDKASDLIDEGKTVEAIKMANEHIKSHPNDEYGYFYRGNAHYLQKEWRLAIDDFNKAEELAPSWKYSYTEPFRAAAKSKLDKQQD